MMILYFVLYFAMFLATRFAGRIACSAGDGVVWSTLVMQIIESLNILRRKDGIA